MPARLSTIPAATSQKRSNFRRQKSTKRPKRKCSPAKSGKPLWVVENDYFRYSVPERLFDPKFDRKTTNSLIKDITPQEFSMERLMREGFPWPLIFKNGIPLGMRVPENLTPEVVANAAGLKSKVEVINCDTQEGIQMPLGQFVEYFTGGEKRSLPRGRISAKIYNLIDLEVSHTRLSDLIDAPLLVRQVDWATNLWPRDLLPPIADLPSEQDHAFSYPKTQKYVLMSKAGSFTDFHIDFGGSSVWYHLVRGKKADRCIRNHPAPPRALVIGQLGRIYVEKFQNGNSQNTRNIFRHIRVFFVIPPSDKNRNLYAQWVRSGQHLLFLADEVDECERIEVSPGDTFMLPSGWIHAVYTLDDSVVVGGNFLTTFTADMQIDISVLEQTLKVKKSTRYPFFNDLLWFALRRYAAVLKGRSPNISPYEIQGVTAVVSYLKSYADLSPSISPIAAKRIYSPLTLLQEVEGHLKRLEMYSRNGVQIFAMNLPMCDRHVDSPEIRQPCPQQLVLNPVGNGITDHKLFLELPGASAPCAVSDSWTQTEISWPRLSQYPVIPWYFWNYSSGLPNETAALDFGFPSGFPSPANCNLFPADFRSAETRGSSTLEQPALTYMQL